jgi:hypothetical protein
MFGGRAMDSSLTAKVREPELDMRRERMKPRSAMERVRTRLGWQRPFASAISTPRRSLDRISWELYHEFD